MGDSGRLWKALPAPEGRGGLQGPLEGSEVLQRVLRIAMLFAPTRRPILSVPRGCSRETGGNALITVWGRYLRCAQAVAAGLPWHSPSTQPGAAPGPAKVFARGCRGRCRGPPMWRNG
eukprot:13014163-Alexandrium_andersonii.AAC.1